MARHFKPQSLDLYTKLGTPSQIMVRSRISKLNSAGSINASMVEDISPRATISENFFITESKHHRALSAVPIEKRSISPHVRSPVAFDKQLPRPEFLDHIQSDVHHNRFVAFDNTPKIFSKTQHVRTPRMSKYLGRESFKMHKDLSEEPSYDANYKAVKHNTEKGTIPFNKSKGRPPFYKITANDVVIDAVNYAQLDSKIQSPNLSKSPPKPCDPTLPAFMLSGTDRNALKLISIKTLEMNSYMKTDFVPLTSTFGDS